MDVDRLVLADGRLPPYLLQQLTARHNPPRAGGEVRQQVELLGRQLDRAIGPAHLAPAPSPVATRAPPPARPARAASNRGRPRRVARVRRWPVRPARHARAPPDGRRRTARVRGCATTSTTFSSRTSSRNRPLVGVRLRTGLAAPALGLVRQRDPKRAALTRLEHVHAAGHAAWHHPDLDRGRIQQRARGE